MARITVSAAKIIFGDDVINNLISAECEPTSRLIYPGYPHYGEDEWQVQDEVEATANDGKTYLLSAYVYTTEDNDIEYVIDDDFEINADEIQ